MAAPTEVEEIDRATVFSDDADGDCDLPHPPEAPQSAVPKRERSADDPGTQNAKRRRTRDNHGDLLHEMKQGRLPMLWQASQPVRLYQWVADSGGVDKWRIFLGHTSLSVHGPEQCPGRSMLCFGKDVTCEIMQDHPLQWGTAQRCLIWTAKTTVASRSDTGLCTLALRFSDAGDQDVLVEGLRRRGPQLTVIP
eukprot:TRINITY_DN16327_c0_g2_i1.p1 TRINITY_DN16327_c0_g2~~TRINITY_DN16327_c0_g2_i1.p1  ORF type:complete len:194 (+),score=19.40 TRINITY_DN16327_c0_g2_i1:72-653(+)